jgi:type VI secretion system protein ImpK
MGTSPPNVGSLQGATAPAYRNRDNLALDYQEVLTAIVRLRSNRQAVPDAGVFRNHVRVALKGAEAEAARDGYAPEDARLATFAVVAFLDESILNSANPVFADWPRMPLQEELFGGHVAGEIFFQCLERLLARGDSREVADVLEIYALCLMLGYRGRHSMGGQETLRPIIDSITEKIRRIRGSATALSPNWLPPPEGARVKVSDRWVRRLGIGAVACFLLAVLLFVGFKVSLSSGASALRSATSVAGR